MTDEYQKFYERWDKRSKRSKFRNKFPYKLSLGTNSKGEPLLPFRNDGMSGDKILVTKSYDRMLYRLLDIRKKRWGRGAVITGQPGIGGSL